MDISEKSFEEAIERALLAGGPDALPGAVTQVAERKPPYMTLLSGVMGEPGGYRKGRSQDYDREKCLLPGPVMDFILATQPREWQKFQQLHGQNARARFLQRLSDEIESRGTLDVLRNGIRSSGTSFRLYYPRPASSLNPQLQQMYEGNLFTVVRQLHYSVRQPSNPDQRKGILDLAIFLNGLPLFTAELKNPFTGQTVEDAVYQYRNDRDPREPLFAFGRCLVHFAVDTDQVQMTTRLEGLRTRFLPFNQGRYGGAGNPPSATGFATSYLWEQVWSKDSVLNLIQHFIQQYEVEDEAGRKTGERRIIFPRYHQLDAVRRLVSDAREKGPGQRYLIQHSAGSGKSNSIAWLAHQLSVLHDPQDRRVFDSIIVVTDRRVLDRQLQQTVRQFEQVRGLVENIDQTSQQLKQALESGKTIIVTTLQKFGVIVDQMAALPGQRFAVIVDEAHSSQSGSSSNQLRSVLKVKNLQTDKSLEEAAAQEENADAAVVDEVEQRVADTMEARGPLPNVSTFAFTATPKAKTLELFGQRTEKGGFEPFSLYSMRQAIEEGFILDVLQNYTTYNTYWNLLKKVEDDPRYDRATASQLLKSFVDLHPHAIQKKVAIMLEHFDNQVAPQIEGKAKAMIVTRSRLHAVRYKLAVDEYLRRKGVTYKALVAFSGSVREGDDEGDNATVYTEAGMNGLPESQTAQAFKSDEYRIMIVANKFQTGFDEPLLQAMYVDKRLGGVNAVQTLSRLNRTHPAKLDTMVLDFANTADDIQKSFEPYYESTLLEGSVDPDLLYDMQNRLDSFHFYTQAEVENFVRLYYDLTQGQDKLHMALSPVVDRYKTAHQDEQTEFRRYLKDYTRLYVFIAQLLTFMDTSLEKAYQFDRLLLRKLPVHRERLPVEIQQNIDIESYRVQPTGQQRIVLQRGQRELKPIGADSAADFLPDAKELEALSQIIAQLNQRFGTNFSDEDRVVIRSLEERVNADTALELSRQVNNREDFRLTFQQVVSDRLYDLMNTNFKFYKQVTDDQQFATFLIDVLFERYLGRSAA